MIPENTVPMIPQIELIDIINLDYVTKRMFCNVITIARGAFIAEIGESLVP